MSTQVANPYKRRIVEEDSGATQRAVVAQPAAAARTVEECCICLENLESSGDHRIVSLKCGHLYGRNCIERALKERRFCPCCSQKAKVSDIRLIFTSCFSVVNTSERDSAREELAKERKRREQAEARNVQLQIQCDALRTSMSDMVQLQKTEAIFPSQVSTPCASTLTQSQFSSQLDGGLISMKALITQPQPQKVALFRINGGRCVRFCSDWVLASCHHGGDSHGILRASLIANGHQQALRLHSKPIRDMDVQGVRLLTTSLDRTVNVHDLGANLKVTSLRLPSDGWSCCWAPNHRVFCGMANGEVQEFDLRRVGLQVVKKWQGPFANCPLHSLCYIPDQENDEGKPCLVGANLQGGVSWTSTGQGSQDVIGQRLEGVGPACSSLSTISTAAPHPLFLSTHRSTHNGSPPYLRQLSLIQNEAAVPNIDTSNADEFDYEIAEQRTAAFIQRGSDMCGHTHATSLSRSCGWISECGFSGQKVMVASGDEATNSAFIWEDGDIKYKNLTKHPSHVLSVDAITVNATTLLASISAQQVTVDKLNT